MVKFPSSWFLVANPTRTCASPDRVVVLHVLDEIYGVKKQSIISAKIKLWCVLFLSFQHICLIIFFGEFPTETLFVGCLKVFESERTPRDSRVFFCCDSRLVRYVGFGVASSYSSKIDWGQPL